MNIRKILAMKGVHFLFTRFGTRRMRGMAFDAKYESGQWNFRGDRRGELASTVVQYLNGGSLLMLGCGGARVVEGLLAQEFTSILGVDLSAKAVEMAKRLSSERITFQQADMATFNPPDSYDVILFSESLNYLSVTNGRKLLLRLRDNLRKDGVFIVTLSDADRYSAIIEMVRNSFSIFEDRTFVGSCRYLLVFS